MQSWYDAISLKQRRRFFWISLTMTLGLMATLNIVGAPLVTIEAPCGIISYELAKTLPRAQAILESWDHNTQVHAAFSLGLDYLFMPAYAFCIGLACLWAGEMLGRRGWPLVVVGVASVLLVVLIMAILLLFALSARGQILLPSGQSIDMYLWLGVSFLGAIIFLAFLFKIRISRFVLYGMVFLLCVFGGWLLELIPGWVVIVAGAGIIAYGVWLLIRFLRKYPVMGQDQEQDMEVGNDAGQ